MSAVRAVRPCLLCALAVSSAGCLVTEQIRFDEANVAANLSIVSPAEFTRVRRDAVTSCNEDGVSTGMPFEVAIADGNVDDVLQLRAIVDSDIVVRVPQIPSTGKVQRENQQVCIDFADLTAKCNYVVIAVSRRFADSANPLAVEEPNDLGIASFFVLGDAENNADADPEDCARLLNDGGAP